MVGIGGAALLLDRPFPRARIVHWQNGGSTRVLATVEGPIREPRAAPGGSGQTVEGVLFWPPGQRGSSGLPLVVSLHGGPDLARTEALALGIPWAFYPALLASRGYLVLEPNFRGSTGRGDAFMRIEGAVCSLPAKDVLSGVDHLVGRGWADSARLGLFGYSFGGELTACLLGRTNRCRAAVAGSGIWNEISYYGTAENGALTSLYLGSKPPWESFETYWGESPISGAGRIRTPTPLTTGDADDVVPPAQSFEFYRALRANGVPAERLVFPNQGHSYTRPSFMRSKVEAEVNWLDRYLLRSP
jgi:dipeptidyl aminopeptidase/acylaminoacyl peptidase